MFPWHFIADSEVSVEHLSSGSTILMEFSFKDKASVHQLIPQFNALFSKATLDRNF